MNAAIALRLAAMERRLDKLEALLAGDKPEPTKPAKNTPARSVGRRAGDKR